MQIVYISNRPEIARETLEYVENLMPFVTEALFVCPGSQVKDFHFKGRIPVKAIDEASVLGKDLGRFKDSSDHVFRNCLLRFSLVRMADLGDEFIMSDDDNRPLVDIPFSLYKEQGRYRGYYFYDLKKWRPFETDFDKGQQVTRNILEEKGFSTLSYSSHMPQLINKGLLSEVAEAFRSNQDQGMPIEEWNAYFNYGQGVHPERFTNPKPFKTLCWPPFPSDWPLDVHPEGFYFENFYPVLYQKGMVFSGLPTRFDEKRCVEISNEKIRRRISLQNTFEAGGISPLGKMFFWCRDLAEHFPNLKRRLNAMIPSSRQAALLNYFLGYSGKGRNGRDVKWEVAFFSKLPVLGYRLPVRKEVY